MLPSPFSLRFRPSPSSPNSQKSSSVLARRRQSQGHLGLSKSPRLNPPSMPVALRPSVLFLAHGSTSSHVLQRPAAASVLRHRSDPLCRFAIVSVTPGPTGLHTWPTSYRIKGGTWPTPYTSCNYLKRSRTTHTLVQLVGDSRKLPENHSGRTLELVSD
jgi:hypothetical protein